LSVDSATRFFPLEGKRSGSFAQLFVREQPAGSRNLKRRGYSRTFSACRLLRRQRAHVDHEAILDAGAFHPFERMIDVLHRDHFAIRQDVFLGAEVEQFLRLRAGLIYVKVWRHCGAAGRIKDEKLFTMVDADRRQLPHGGSVGISQRVSATPGLQRKGLT
jgi:hypothetical protein